MPSTRSLSVPTLLRLVSDVARFVAAMCRPRAALAAENLFLVYWNVPRYPSATWTAQQFRMITPGDHRHRYVLHDRDNIFAEGVDRTLTAMALTVLKTPVRAPQANAFCERLIGTMRRECLDFMIPLNERHPRWVLSRWVADYNRGRPHAGLGPCIPDLSRISYHTRERPASRTGFA
jgi:hypothetical protein